MDLTRRVTRTGGAFVSAGYTYTAVVLVDPPVSERSGPTRDPNRTFFRLSSNVSSISHRLTERSAYVTSERNTYVCLHCHHRPLQPLFLASERPSQLLACDLGLETAGTVQLYLGEMNGSRTALVETRGGRASQLPNSRPRPIPEFEAGRIDA